MMADGDVEIKIEETDWEYEHELELLEEGLRLIADKCRADETKKMVNTIEVGLLSQRLYLRLTSTVRLTNPSELVNVNYSNLSKWQCRNRLWKCGTWY